jgi:hypothetical protein
MVTFPIKDFVSVNASSTSVMILGILLVELYKVKISFLDVDISV